MKHTFYILTLTFGLFSCNTQTEKIKDNTSADTIPTSSIKTESTTLHSIDETKFDKAFLDALSEYKDSIKLIDNYILIKQDTVYFPEDTPLKKEVIFKGKQDQKEVILKVTRLNLTSLKYNFQLLDKDKNIIDQESGTVTLSPFFFLGSEVDNDDRSNDGYLSIEYRNTSNCSLSIRIGEKDDNGRLRAKIDRYCKDNKSKNIDLDDYPTLRTE